MTFPIDGRPRTFLLRISAGHCSLGSGSMVLEHSPTDLSENDSLENLRLLGRLFEWFGTGNLIWHQKWNRQSGSRRMSLVVMSG